MKFSELELSREVLKGVSKAGFKQCMPVQERVLPVSLSGSDVMVQSKTGSGKTAVYVLTFLQRFAKSKKSDKRSAALVVAPTRELAQQIASDAEILSSGIPSFKVGCFVGGTGYDKQRKALKSGCDMFVGTPGRLLEFLNDGEIDGKGIDTFIIDEADRLFDMGFYPDIRRMFGKLCKPDQRQTMLFSATLEMRVRQLAWEYMNNPAEIEMASSTITVEQIQQELYHIAKSEKFGLMLQLLKAESPQSAIIFTNSRHMAQEVAIRLQYNGWNADYLTGDLPQKAREKALDKMKNGKTAILVATDVAARGLQIDDLPLVVNYDIPEDYENYVHRIGRTARAGKSGKSITLADEEFVYGLEPIEKYIKMKIPVIWPENLPEVEDLSKGRSWRTREDERHEAFEKRKNQSRSKASQPSQPSKPSQKAQKPTDYKKLGSMTEAERMAYYKKKYGL